MPLDRKEFKPAPAEIQSHFGGFAELRGPHNEEALAELHRKALEKERAGQRDDAGESETGDS